MTKVYTLDLPPGAGAGLEPKTRPGWKQRAQEMGRLNRMWQRNLPGYIRSGWRQGTVAEFLQLTPKEAEAVEKQVQDVTNHSS